MKLKLSKPLSLLDYFPFNSFFLHKRVEGKIREVKQDSDTGFIQALHLESGQIVEGDFFIDCSGFRGLLIEQTLQTGYEDWSHWLPCDTAQAVQTESIREPSAYTRSIAHHAGWRWQIPLQHRVGNGLVYCGQFMDDDEARSTLLNSVKGKTLVEPRVIKYRTGRSRKSWNKNCVALGLASGFIEPLESTSIHLVIMAVTRLMRYFPFAGVVPELANEFNRESLMEIERIRDFIILHYKATEREDSPFWRYCKNMEVPATLAHRMDLFRNTGHAYQDPGELFRIDSWTQVMLGQRIMPVEYHRIADMMPEQELQKFLMQLKQSVLADTHKLPSHQDFINRYCHAVIE